MGSMRSSTARIDSDWIPTLRNASLRLRYHPNPTKGMMGATPMYVRAPSYSNVPSRHRLSYKSLVTRNMIGEGMSHYVTKIYPNLTVLCLNMVCIAQSIPFTNMQQTIR